MRTLEEWYELIGQLCSGTDYEVMYNKAKGSKAGVAIVPAGMSGPQRICVYPRKTKDPGLVLEMDIYDRLASLCELGTPNRVKGNRPHYTEVEEEKIIQVIRHFVGRMIERDNIS